MSNCPDIDRVLSIRDRLGTVISHCAVQAEKLSGESSAHPGTYEKHLTDAIQEEQAAIASGVAEMEDAFAAKQKALAERDEKRGRWIGHAHASSKKRLGAWIDGVGGRRKNKIQIALMKADRLHDEGLEEEQREFARRKEALSSAVAELERLERNSRRRFLVYVGCIALGQGVSPLRECDCHDGYETLVGRSEQAAAAVWEALDSFRKARSTWLGKFLSMWLLVPVLGVGLVFVLLEQYQVLPLSESCGIWARYAVAASALLCAVHLAGLRCARAIGHVVAKHLDALSMLLTVCGHRVVLDHRQRMTDVETTYETTVAQLNRQWKVPLEDEAPGLKAERERALDAKAARLRERHESLSCMRREADEKALRADVDELRRKSEARMAMLREEQAVRREQVERDLGEQWQAVEAEWQSTVPSLYAAIAEAKESADALFPDWNHACWDDWTPPQHLLEAVEFARLNVDLESLCEHMPSGDRLVLPGNSTFSLPVCLTFPEHGSLLFETRTACRDCVLGALNNIMLRLLSLAPPGKVAFTILDPVELGQNFAGIMHLADYEESVVNRRIWTQPRHIEERLAELNEHMEKVIQMYLRNEYQTIADYNRQAGDVAEKYHFLVVADFPANFTDLAARRLLSIASSGPRCGVYLLLHWDQRRPVPQDFVPDALRKNMVRLTAMGNEFIFFGRGARGSELVLSSPPEPTRSTDFLKKVGRTSIDSNRIEVPFSHVSPEAARIWSEDTAEELRVPVGRTGATKLQYLALGKGTRQHVLIAGKTGSGKSTLFHVLISNLALWCSPEQVEFYLVDFKKGVEFKCYATHRLPHARVVAIESDREFGLSVLERVDEELKRRGDLFRNLGVQDLAGYRKNSGGQTMPRTLLVVDEFQEFFTQDDRISQAASLLLDRIVRQGRAFGIHVLLGSQTLGGAYTLARATLGQMAVRIALQCNEADAYLIMDDDNAAPRLLSRPGEAIYNDASGRMEGNSPFQVVWLGDEERDCQLAMVRKLVEREHADCPAPVVFEGNAPAGITSNIVLSRLLSEVPTRVPGTARIWLGEPNRIKGPTEVGFTRQSGSNLLIVGQQDEAVLATLGIALVSLAAQHPVGKVRLVVISAALPDSPQREFLDRVSDAIPHDVTIADVRAIPSVVNELAQELERRNSDEWDEAAAATFLLIHGIQKHKKLRFEENFGFSTEPGDAAPNLGAQLNELISEGSGLGMHLIVTCDTNSNVSRCFSRKAVGEFDMRVLFQMSPNDSASLIDSPVASQLGLHRALLHDEQQGYTELYRPYALPANEWLVEVSRCLSAVD